MEYNPEQSPFFRGYEYTNKFDELLKRNAKATFYDEMPLHEMNKWADRQEPGVVMGFASANPDFSVTEMVDGEKKTITLPFWARDNVSTAPQRLYAKSPWVFRCVDIKAKAFAGMSWAIYPEDPMTADDDVEAFDETDPAVELLTEVNPEDNWPDLIAKTSKDLDLYGVAFWEKIRSKTDRDKLLESEEGVVVTGTGEPILLQRLNPATMEVLGDEKGIKGFKQQLDAEPIIFERENILYFRGYDPANDLGSISPLESCKGNVEVELEANSHLADFFANNAMPTMIMSTPDSVQFPDLQKLQGNFKKEFKGKGKRGKTAFMSHGFKPEQLSYPLNQLALKEIREESRKSICAAFGVPPTLAGAWEAANFATADIGRKSLYTETVIPISAYMAGVLNAELMNEFDDEHFFRFEPEKLDVMQENTGERANWLSTLVEKKILKPEVAAVEMGFTEEDVPEPVENPFTVPQNGQENDFSGNGQSGNEEKAQKAQADLMVDLNKWRRKSISRVRKNKTPFCAFESEYIPEILTSVIEKGLMNAETVDDVHGLFNGANNRKEGN